MSNQSFMPDPRYEQSNEPTERISYPEQGQGYSNYNAGPVNEGNRYVQGRPENHGAPNYAAPNGNQYVAPDGNQIERREEIYADSQQRRANLRYWTAAVVYFLLSVLEILLVLRFLFRFLGANEGNGFVLFLYNFTYVFVAPFEGIFRDPSFSQNHVFEVSTLLAMLIYALIAWGIVALSRVVLGPAMTNRRSVTMRQRRDIS
jgi:hypothetical protein